MGSHDTPQVFRSWRAFAVETILVMHGEGLGLVVQCQSSNCVVRMVGSEVRKAVLVVLRSGAPKLTGRVVYVSTDLTSAAVLNGLDFRVLVIDDAAHNGTFELGLRYRQSHAALHLTVLHNLSNQGYGGNQKVRYIYAIPEGLDIVAFADGAGQHALLRALLCTDQTPIRSSPGLFSYHVFVSASVTPDGACAILSTRTSVGAAA